MTLDYPVRTENSEKRMPGSAMHFDLDIRRSRVTGRDIWHVPFQSISDIHWMSHFSRAKRVCMLFRDVESDVLRGQGDLIGGIEMMNKETRHTGPWHRQGMALFLQKAETSDVAAAIGNHEVGAERYLPATLYNVGLYEESVYLDPSGRLFLLEHGHKHRHKVLDKKWDAVGDTLLHMADKIDLFLQDRLGLEKASVAVTGKRWTKGTINKAMGVLKETEQFIDNSPYDGSISGDTHMIGFHRTPGDKLLINDGDCCSHVQDVRCDKYGNWAAFTNHRDHVNIEMEGGNRYTIHYTDVGLSHFADPPHEAESQWTQKADRVLSLANALWPARDRQNIQKRTEEKERAVERLFEILSVDSKMPPQLHWALHNELGQLGGLDELRRTNSATRNTRSRDSELAVAV